MIDIKYRMKKMFEWYTNPAIKFAIINTTKNRETSFLMPSWVDEDLKRANTRMLKCHSVQHLDFLFKVLDVYKREKPYNVYYSIAKYIEGIPNQDFSYLKMRDNSEWNKTHYHFITDYDYFIDIDAPDFNDLDFALESTKELKSLFDVLNVPYTLIFSGMGFHFKIPYKYLPKDLSFNPKDDENIYKMLSECTDKLYDLISEMIDTSIYDSKRLCKIPFTLANYDDRIVVCSPINSIEQLNAFDVDNYKIENYIFLTSEIKVYNENGDFNNLLSYLKNTNKGE